IPPSFSRPTSITAMLSAESAGVFTTSGRTTTLMLGCWEAICARAAVVMHTSAATSRDRKSTRLNSSHSQISYAVFCLTKKDKYPVLVHQTYKHAMPRFFSPVQGTILTPTHLLFPPTATESTHALTAYGSFTATYTPSK